MRAWLRRWLLGDDRLTNIYAGLPVPSDDSIGEKIKPTVKVGVVEAMNGKLLEVSSYKPNSRGPDWTTTYWIMDDSPLAEQIAVVIAMKGLAK